MKNQYFGDVNDYRKYGILRILAGSDLNVIVSWMLTPDDGRTDGKFIGYLDQENRWRHHDPPLYDHLRASLQDGAPRAVSSVESGGLLARATFVADLLLDQAASRSAWLDRTCAAACEADLVFFDPDNGLEVKSVRKDRKGSAKYLYWNELQKVWECGASLLIYQHFPRAERSRFLQDVGDQMCRRLGVTDVVALKTANVAFFLVPQQRHWEQLTSRLATVENTWDGQVTCVHIRPSPSESASAYAADPSALPAAPPMLQGYRKMNFAGALKSQLRLRAESWSTSTEGQSYNSLGNPGTLLFVGTGARHGNFFDDVWQALSKNADWKARLGKRHPKVGTLPPERQSDAKEMDSSNSSDALLMNCFCYPGASARMSAVLGASPADAVPQFGVAGSVELTSGAADRTEIDMRLGDTFVEAKLTEANFTSKPRSDVARYAGLDNVFDVEMLPGNATHLHGYQLIRNVLAANQHGTRLVVLVDCRRPDLVREWWDVHSAIKSATLRQRCTIRLWQELAAAADSEHREMLHEKYGL